MNRITRDIQTLTYSTRLEQGCLCCYSSACDSLCAKCVSAHTDRDRRCEDVNREIGQCFPTSHVHIVGQQRHSEEGCERISWTPVGFRDVFRCDYKHVRKLERCEYRFFSAIMLLNLIGVSMWLSVAASQLTRWKNIICWWCMFKIKQNNSAFVVSCLMDLLIIQDDWYKASLHTYS